MEGERTSEENREGVGGGEKKKNGIENVGERRTEIRIEERDYYFSVIVENL